MINKEQTEIEDLTKDQSVEIDESNNEIKPTINSNVDYLDSKILNIKEYSYDDLDKLNHNIDDDKKFDSDLYVTNFAEVN